MRSFLSCIVLFALCVGLRAQQPPSWKNTPRKAERKPSTVATIEFSPIHLALGMPKEQVLTVLAEHYDVSPWKGRGGDLWGVARQTEPHFLVGTVQFDGNRLSFASRMWENSNTAFSAIHVTANLMARLRDEGFSECSVSTEKESEAENERERDSIMINCGQKGVAISSERAKVKGLESETVDIVERLEPVTSAKSALMK